MPEKEEGNFNIALVQFKLICPSELAEERE
jgi:hypothetical protein